MRVVITLWLFLILTQSGIGMGAGLEADQILAEADTIRFPKDPFEIVAEMTTKKNSGEEEILRMRVTSKGPEKVLCEFTAPLREAGKAVLLVGDNMWMYLPNLKKAIRISPSQQLLSSNFSNGDILRIDFTGDYHARLVGIEQLDGKEVYHLELTAKKKEATYQKAHYWVQKDGLMPIKAEFFAVSGRLLKVLSFIEFGEMAGRLRPLKMTMTNPLKKGEVSIMVFKKIEIVPLSDSRFNPNLLGKK